MQTRLLSNLHRSFRLAGGLLLSGAVATGCSDDGNALGSQNGGSSGAGSSSAGKGAGGTAATAGGKGDSTAGAAGSAMQGGMASAAGSATQGGMASTAGSATQGGMAGSTANAGAGGTAGGGSGGTAQGGMAGAGGRPACEAGLCIRANVCLDRCGGSPVYTGCCPCPANTFEELTCTGGGGSGGGTGVGCVGKTCAVNETCVGYRVVGGAMTPPDQSNQCPTGRHLEGNTCQHDFGYTCATLTNCSSLSATCRCAPGTDCANTTVCRLPQASTWLDASAQLVCELQAP